MIAGQTRETIAEPDDLPTFVTVCRRRLAAGTKVE
jgi:hypothetical protein